MIRMITQEKWKQMVGLLLSSKDSKLPVAILTTGLNHLSLWFIETSQTQPPLGYCPLLQVKFPFLFQLV
jgi:hypothetical protein